MKLIKFWTIVLSAAVLLNGCNHIGSVQMNKALEHFIKFEQIVNEHDALGRELDWHEPRDSKTEDQKPYRQGSDQPVQQIWQRA